MFVCGEASSVRVCLCHLHISIGIGDGIGDRFLLGPLAVGFAPFPGYLDVVDLSESTIWITS